MSLRMSTRRSAGEPLPQYSPPQDLDVSDVDLSMMGTDLLGGAPVSYMPPAERQRYINGVQIKAKYVGTIEVPQPRGMQTVVTAIGRVRALHKTSKESKRKVLFIVSTSGIRIMNYETMQLRDSYNLAKISFVATLPSNKKVFAFVSVNDAFKPATYKCHVFKSDTKSLLLAETIGRCFTLAMEMKRGDQQDQHHRNPGHQSRHPQYSTRRQPPPRPQPPASFRSSSSSKGMGSALPDSFDGIIEAMQRRLHPYPVSNEDAVFFASAFAELQAKHRASQRNAKAMQDGMVRAQHETASMHHKWRDSLQLCNDLQHHLQNLEHRA